MKKTLCLILAFFLLLTSACAPAETPLPPEPGEQPAAPEPAETFEEFGEDLSALITRYEPEEEAEGDYAACRLLVSCEGELDTSLLGAEEILRDPDGVYIIQYDSPEKAEAAKLLLEKIEGVDYAEPDILITLDDPEQHTNCYLGANDIGLESFSYVLARSEYDPVTVAVIDSGVSAHERLEGRLVKGFDFVDSDADPSDEHGHGTHVAGIVANSTPGLDISIMPVRVLNKKGKGYASVVGAGIRHAVDHKVDVINLSLGGKHHPYKEDAIAQAERCGVIVVAAAGNQYGRAENRCPAHIPYCITVSAINTYYEIADFSNYGSVIDFCAPGVDISSCVPGGYEDMSGTSMATPHISAAVALLKAAGLVESHSDVEEILMRISNDLGEPGWDEYYGYGLPELWNLYELMWDGSSETFLNDGAYPVTLWGDTVKATEYGEQIYISLMEYEEVPNKVIEDLKPGDVIWLHHDAIEVASFQRYDSYNEELGRSHSEIWFEPSGYGCYYIEETDTWRFMNPAMVSFTYIVTGFDIPVPFETEIVDRFYSMSFGKTIYGESLYRADGTPREDMEALMRVNSMEEYFIALREGGYDEVPAIITVQDGKITDIEILLLDGPSETFLNDGTYPVTLWGDTVKATEYGEQIYISLMEYEEVPNKVIEDLKPGDVIWLHHDAIEVASFQRYDSYNEELGRSHSEIWFEPSGYGCYYIEETDTWRFMNPAMVSFTYIVTGFDIPVPFETEIVDRFYSMSFGKTIYGESLYRADGTPREDMEALMRVNSMEEYFIALREEGYNEVPAIITVQDGKITDIETLFVP